MGTPRNTREKKVYPQSKNARRFKEKFNKAWARLFDESQTPCKIYCNRKVESTHEIRIYEGEPHDRQEVFRKKVTTALTTHETDDPNIIKIECRVYAERTTLLFWHDENFYKTPTSKKEKRENTLVRVQKNSWILYRIFAALSENF